jgi:type IV secretory pathway VirJ component
MLENPWIAFQGTIDQVCDAAAVEAYVKNVSQGEIVLLPKVGHGFSVQKNWMRQFRETFTRLVSSPEALKTSATNELKDLPLVEVPAYGTSSNTMAVILSGDGGWASIDREVGNALASRGISVIGLNSLQYFWTRRTPDGAAKDLERILRYYLALWKKEKIILAGYSLGADVLPFMASRLPEDLLSRVNLIALLSPSQKADFEFHLTDWLGNFAHTTALPVQPEVERLRGKKILCFCGDKETGSLCDKLDPSLALTFRLKGAHHFGGNYNTIVEIILKEIQL